MDKNIKSAVERFTKTLSEIQSIVLENLGTENVKARLDGNFVTLNSPVSINLQFFVLTNDLDRDHGVCLSVSFQNHEPVVGGLELQKPNELYVYADLTYIEGPEISNFGIVKLSTDGVDYQSKLEEVTETILLYFNGQVPVIVSKLNENLSLFKA